ncbi:uncharacterized protein DUF1656 [Acinetobacter calcoaceticus]|uniref:Uncharacterized protein DUF1656 n=1 Tax=Acinetobacter calcoaceticus TaxID=471 RepID=A0A4R1Y1Q9_ACICA|nr:uncharacterized protein DUF1656 [Acinetobacter calcoaceticus]
MGEFNFYDIYIPTLLVQALIAYVLFKLLSPVINRLIASGWIIYANIFNLCFYLSLLLLVHVFFIVIDL